MRNNREERYFYKGWEYEHGNHMFQSRRHIFADWSAIALCGAKNPYHIHANRNEGDGACKRCEYIATKRGLVAD